MDVRMGVRAQAPRALSPWDSAKDEESRVGGQVGCGLPSTESEHRLAGVRES